MTTTTTACRTPRCTAPPEADHATLHRTRNADLLTAAFALTHRMHEAADTVRATNARWAEQTEADLRTQRDLITAELLRRLGETP